MEPLILHLVGDYVLQSHWMAQNKAQYTHAALAHAFCYSLPFLLIGSFSAVAVIAASHFLVDRFRLARYVVWLKNTILMPPALRKEGNYYRAEEEDWRWFHCRETGYPPNTPQWLAVGLLIVADNTIHLICNYAALHYL